MTKKANKKYGSKKYSKFNDGNTVGYALFSHKPLQYIVPKALIYPILCSFRLLLYYDEVKNIYRWKNEPLEVWSEIGPKLAEVTMGFSDIHNNVPVNMGKSVRMWDALQEKLLIYSLKQN
jgi:hypothetical protein